MADDPNNSNGPSESNLTESSLTESNQASEAGSSTEGKPAQIPLLDDVVYNTSLPFAIPKQKPQSRPKSENDAPAAAEQPELPAQRRPRPTDLFGGSPDTAQSGPLTPEYHATDMDKASAILKGSSGRVVDNLVAEYSKEIIERLRDDLTSILDDLSKTQDSSNPEPSDSTRDLLGSSDNLAGNESGTEAADDPKDQT